MSESLAIRGGDPVREEELSFGSPFIGEDEIQAVEDTLRSGWLTTGQRTNEFEETVSNRVGAEHGLATTNCTSALYLAYRALGLSGEIITTPMTFATTVSSAMMAGAEPKLADIRHDTLTLDPESVKEAITPNTEAIVPVHYAGQAVDMDAISEIADDHDLAVIEDAAHGLGGQYQGTPQGTLGDVGCYSFYATKSITTGEGGMLVTDRDEIADKVDRLRLAGVNKNAWRREDQDKPNWYYDVMDASGKFNMNDLSASIGLVQMERLDSFIETRQTVANRLDQQLENVPFVRPLGVRDPTEHARHIYPILLSSEIEIDRISFDDALNAEGIGTSVHYIPIHHHSAFEKVDRVELDVTESLADNLLCVPIHPEMDVTDADDVVRAIEKVVAAY